MKIILKENVAGLGFKDDVVEVKDGYGRNYLIPKGLAVVATKSALKQHEEIMRQRAHKLEQLKAEAQKAASAIENVSLTIPAKLNEAGTIFGSVNAAHIAEELAKLGHEIDVKIIELEPVKEAGNYSAKVRFHKEVVVEIPFVVISEDAPVVEAPAEEAPAEEAPAETAE